MNSDILLSLRTVFCILYSKEGFNFGQSEISVDANIWPNKFKSLTKTVSTSIWQKRKTELYYIDYKV